MLFRSAWMVAWLIVSLNTHTLGPKAATVAPGHAEETGAWAGRTAAPALSGAAARPAAASAATASRASLPLPLPLPLPLLGMNHGAAPPGGRVEAHPGWLTLRMAASSPF